MIKQSELLHKDWDWIIICDAGRADVFKDIYRRFFEGRYHTAYNGGISFTANWFSYHFSDYYDYYLFHGGLPIHAFSYNPDNYDEREHFSEVIAWEEYDWDERRSMCPPDVVINVVNESEANKGVIRFLQPHNPYRKLNDIYGTQHAKQYTHNELKIAYYDNYRWVLQNISNRLLPILSGDIIITSDHGQCLGDCGQYLHSPTHDKHDHLINVPFLILE